MQPYGLEYFETISPQKGLAGLQKNPCKLLDFSVVSLNPGENHAFETGEREVALVVLTGTVDMRVNGLPFEKVGGRATVFSGPPAMVYAPCGSAVTVIAYDNAELALCSCPSQTKIAPYRLDAGDVVSGKWGRYNTSRHFNYLLNISRPSERLHIAEVTVISGNWATYPPHKHEQNEPVHGEVFQEEMYYFRVDPMEGFGLAALYGGQAEGDYAFMVRNNTILKMPHGYHTLTVAPGYRLWYLALIAGDGKAAQPVVDPAHGWFSRMDTYLENLEKNLQAR
jgi:5-deoxy-glucuronate isomerase